MSIQYIVPTDTPNTGKDKINANFDYLQNIINVLGGNINLQAQNISYTNSDPNFTTVTNVKTALDAVITTENTLQTQVTNNNNTVGANISSLQTGLANHINDHTNPHQVDATQVSILSTLFNYLTTKKVETALLDIINRIVLLETNAFNFVRSQVALTSITIAPSGQLTGSFPVAKSFLLLQAALSVAPTANLRVRLYTKASYRDQDLTRPIGVDPSEPTYGGEHGVIADLVFTNTKYSLDFAPLIAGMNIDSPVTSTIYYTVDNFDVTAATPTVTFTIMKLEK